MRVLTPLILATAIVSAGCGEGPETAPLADLNCSRDTSAGSPHFSDNDALIREKGKAVVQEAFSLLSSNLLAALSAGGPSNAIPFCSVKALPLTETVSKHYEVELRRVSHRVRNPKSLPGTEESAVLDTFESELSAGRMPAPIVNRTENQAFFYAPIVIRNPLCLTCHGEPGKEIATGTLKLLEKLYPEDKATGFKTNELRGMWVVGIRPDAPSP